MGSAVVELEGTWEEIAARAAEWAGRRVRLSVLEEAPAASEPNSPVFRPGNGPSTARSLLKFAGTWAGDDLEECLQLVYATRSRAKF